MFNTENLHRVFAANPEKIFRAFTDPDAFVRRLPPNDYTAHVDHLSAKVGETFHMSFTIFTTGKSQSFGGEYRVLVHSERIEYADVFDDPELKGEMLTTVTLREVSCETEVNIVQEGIFYLVPVEQCYLGWHQSLNHLATLVETEIPD